MLQTPAEEDDFDDEDDCCQHLRTSMDTLHQLEGDYAQTVVGEVDIVWSVLFSACRNALLSLNSESVPTSSHTTETFGSVWYTVNLMTIHCS